MLLKNNDTILRVLQSHDDKALVIDCVKRTMPKWVEKTFLSDYVECCDTEMYECTDYPAGRTLTQEERRIAQEHYTKIAGVLPFIHNEQKRSQMIDFLSEQCSKQTIRKYLCLYLVYQEIAALAPPPRKKKELTQDEKNMRWGLNKFFYTKHKNSLKTAYTMMLKEKYCDQHGQLLETYPSFDQFRYFYCKTKKMQKYYISRDGIKDYQRNSRPLLGDGVQQFAPTVGYGMLDSTICDIYLVDDGGKLVGRPIMTACIDAFSGFCCGFALGWEGGTYSLRSLMLNIISNKQEWCKKRGVFIGEQEWDSDKLPAVFVTDMGSEYKGDTFSQITELGVKVINLPPYRPELKSAVEKAFDVIQNAYKKHLKGKGVIEPDYGDYSIRDAIYSKFPEIEKLFPKVECECFEDAVLKCYRVHKKLGLSIWLWILDNFPHALTSDLETQGTTQSWIICNYILSQFGYRDLATHEDYTYKYLSQHPELEDLIFQKSYFYSFPEVVSEYLSYCIAHNLRKNFERVYFGFIKNSLISKFIKKRELILEKTIEYYSDVYIKSINQEFFVFLKREILSLERNVTQNQILNKLNKLKGNYKNK